MPGRFRSYVLASILAIATLSCGDDPTDPSGDVRVTLLTDSITVRVDETAELYVVLRDADGRPLGVPYPFEWRSLDTTVATVDAGTVAGIAPGTTAIVAQTDAHADTAVVVVPEIVPVAVTISEPGMAPMPNDTIVLVATVRDHRGVAVLGATVEWVLLDGADIVETSAHDDTLWLVAARPGVVDVMVHAGELSDTISLVIDDYPPPALPGGTLTFTELGADTILEARVRGRAADLDLVVIETEAWVEGLDVVTWDDDSQRLRAVSPGRARLESIADGARDTLDVTVTPPTPLLFDVRAAVAAAPGDTVVLVGYRLDEGGRPLFGGAPVEATFADSARVGFIVPEPVGCAGAAYVDVGIERVNEPTPLAVRIHRPAEIRLERGDTAHLDVERVGCIQLAPIADAEYALIFVDSSWLHDLRTVNLPARVSFSMAAADRTVRRPMYGSTNQAMRSHGTGSGARVIPPTPRLPALELGDTIDGTHVIVHDDGAYLVSWPIGRLYLWAGDVRDQWIAALVFLQEFVEPVARRSLGALRPVNTQNGRFLIDAPTGLGTSGGSEQHVNIYWQGYVDNRSLHHVVAHEMTHAWHAYNYLVDYDLHEAPHTGQQWAREGIAQYVSAEAHRIAHGIAALSNHEWQDSDFPHYAATARAPSPFPTGYNAGAHFLRDVAWRLVERDRLPYEEARDLVIHHARHGLFGCDATLGHCDAEGVADLVAARFGLDIVDYMTLFMLSVAVDDIFDHPEWRNPYFMRIGSGWGLIRGPLDAGTGSTLEWSAITGIQGLLEIRDDGLGGSFEITPGAQSDFRWVLVRRR